MMLSGCVPIPGSSSYTTIAELLGQTTFKPFHSDFPMI